MGHHHPLRREGYEPQLCLRLVPIRASLCLASSEPALTLSSHQIIENFSNEGGDTSSDPHADPADPEMVAKAKETSIETGEYTYTERDVALYNLGIGATEKELDLIFEGDIDFQAVPTFGVIPQFAISSGLPRAFSLP